MSVTLPALCRPPLIIFNRFDVLVNHTGAPDWDGHRGKRLDTSIVSQPIVSDPAGEETDEEGPANTINVGGRNFYQL